MSNTTAKPWKSSKAFFWETAPFFKLLLPVTAAIIFYDAGLLPVMETTSLAVALIALLVVTSVVFFAKMHGLAAGLFKTLCTITSLFGLAWLLCIHSDPRHDNYWFGKELHQAAAFTGKVLTEPVPTEKTWKFRVQLESCEKGRTIQKATGNGLVYVYKHAQGPDLHKGDRIMLPNTWTPIKSAGNPFEFDYSTYCRRNGFTHQQFIPASSIKLIDTTVKASSIVDQTHQYASGMLSRYVKDTATLGLLQAMLLGDETNFDRDIRRDYAETGIIHIVAISGSHVMLLFQLIAVLFFWLRDKKWSFIKYLIAVPIVCFYVMVAGAPVSAIRSAIMFSFIAAGLLFQKDKQALNQLLLTAFFMLLYEPMWLFAVGFQLSFAAVLSLIIFYKPLYRLIMPSNAILRSLWQVVAASMAAEILTAPLVIFYFHLFPVGFIVANVLAYFFMGVVLAIGLLIIALGKIPVLAVTLGAIATFVVTLFNSIIHGLQSLNPASFSHIHLSLFNTTIVYMIIAGLAVYLLMKKRAGLAVGVIATNLLLITLIIQRYKTLTQEQLVVYNTGKKTYAELLHGTKYTALITDTIANKAIGLATREMHIASHAWTSQNIRQPELVKFGRKTMLILNGPPSIDTTSSFPVDYLLVNYPVRQFDALALRKQYHFQQLVVTGSQKHKALTDWKENCVRQGILAHFTALDGACVLAGN